MLKKTVLAVVLLVFLVSGVFAGDVYVTKSGSKYHAQGCSLIANKDAQAIPLDEAIARGLSACARCLASNQASAQDEKADVVYFTKSGTKYHKANCNLIKNRQTSSATIDEAVKKGLEPCGRCFASHPKA